MKYRQVAQNAGWVKVLPSSPGAAGILLRVISLVAKSRRAADHNNPNPNTQPPTMAKPLPKAPHHQCQPTTHVSTRWRQLGGELPSKDTMLAKQAALEERLNQQKEALLERSLIIQELDSSAERLREEAAGGRHEAVEIGSKVGLCGARLIVLQLGCNRLRCMLPLLLLAQYFRARGEVPAGVAGHMSPAGPSFARRSQTDC